jgi:hypothetical protein
MCWVLLLQKNGKWILRGCGFHPFKTSTHVRHSRISAALGFCCPCAAVCVALDVTSFHVCSATASGGAPRFRCLPTFTWSLEVSLLEVVVPSTVGSSHGRTVILSLLSMYVIKERYFLTNRETYWFVASNRRALLWMLRALAP